MTKFKGNGISYTRAEIAQGIENLIREIESCRRVYLSSGSQYTAESIKQKELRLEELSGLLEYPGMQTTTL